MSLLSGFEAAISSGETVGVERLGEIQDALRVMRDEPEGEVQPFQDRFFLVPVLSFGQPFNRVDLPQIAVQLLRDALGEFAFNRTPVADYMRVRYQWMTPEQRAEKQNEVHFRTQLAKDLAVEHVEVAMFDPRVASGG